MASVLRTMLAGLAMIMTSSCATDAVLPGAQDLEFEPLNFFSGRTHGAGELRQLFSRPIEVSVESNGHLQNGELILDQTVREGNGLARLRRWTIRRIGPHRYSGTLSEAVGEVRVQVEGSRAYIRYHMRHGLVVDQQLAEQRDGTTVLNRLVVRKFGLRVATLRETIRKVDGSVTPVN